jgi:hypothetical protein
VASNFLYCLMKNEAESQPCLGSLPPNGIVNDPLVSSTKQPSHPPSSHCHSEGNII